MRRIGPCTRNESRCRSLARKARLKEATHLDKSRAVLGARSSEATVSEPSTITTLKTEVIDPNRSHATSTVTDVGVELGWISTLGSSKSGTSAGVGSHRASDVSISTLDVSPSTKPRSPCGACLGSQTPSSASLPSVI